MLCAGRLLGLGLVDLGVGNPRCYEASSSCIVGVELIDGRDLVNGWREVASLHLLLLEYTDGLQ